MLFKFAFRNVLRNQRRSFLTALAVFFGAMIVGLAQGWINGMIDMFLNNYVNYQTGHVRITTEEFVRRERFIPVDTLLTNVETIESQVKALPGVRQVEERIRFGILLGRNEATVEALGIGLDLENTAMQVKNKMIAGQLGERGIYIGKDLAAKLRVKLGDELLLATKTSEGGLNGIKLPIQGIFNMGISMYNKKLFFIPLAEAKRLLKIRQAATEIYVFLNQEKLTDSLAIRIQNLLPPGDKAMTYKAQLGALYSTLATMKVVYIFIEALILFLASFVVINTMMMAIFERLPEIGTLKAIGMTDRELFVNFTLEGALIGAAGGIPGALAGYGIISVLSLTGINLEAFVKSVDMPIDYVLHPTLSLTVLLTAIVLSILVPALSAMIPARYAGKLEPAEALRK